jgi:hypothetical protein
MVPGIGNDMDDWTNLVRVAETRAQLLPQSSEAFASNANGSS